MVNPLNYPAGQRAVQICIEFHIYAVPDHLITQYLQQSGRENTPENWNDAIEEIRDVCMKMKKIMTKKSDDRPPVGRKRPRSGAKPAAKPYDRSSWGFKS